MKGGCVLWNTLVEARLALSGGKKDADKGGLSGNDEGGLSRNDTGGFSGDDKGELSNSEKELPGVKDDADVMADSGDDAVPPEYHFVGRGYSRSLMSARQFARERVYGCSPWSLPYTNKQSCTVIPGNPTLHPLHPLHPLHLLPPHNTLSLPPPLHRRTPSSTPSPPHSASPPGRPA